MAYLVRILKGKEGHFGNVAISKGASIFLPQTY
jgi:hypothetical protein